MEKSVESLTHLGHQNLRSLLEHRGKPAVSLYLPQATGPATRLAYRQVLAEVEAQLEDFEFDAREVELIIARLRTLQDSPVFWRQAADGLVLFVSAEHFLYSGSAFAPTRQVVVDEFFYLIPLITHYLNYKTFHILNLNGPLPQLYLASQHEIRRLPDFPAGPASADSAALAIGLLPFFQHQLSPLLVVCSDRTRFDALCQVLDHQPYALECHHCDTRATSLPRLHQEAWQRIAPVLQAELDEALSAYIALADTPKAVQDVSSVAQAAYNSRIDKLFLVAPIQLDKEPPSTPAKEHQRRRVDELLNRAAIYTYLNGGKVYTVRPEELSGAREAAAILRY